jgi:hypothetical protein
MKNDTSFKLLLNKNMLRKAFKTKTSDFTNSKSLVLSLIDNSNYYVCDKPPPDAVCNIRLP